MKVNNEQVSQLELAYATKGSKKINSHSSLNTITLSRKKSKRSFIELDPLKWDSVELL